MKDLYNNLLTSLEGVANSGMLAAGYEFIASTSRFSRQENVNHFCAFIVPIHRPSESVYIGHHIKADIWIPPGGHIEPDEDPVETVIREAGEEIQYTPDHAQIRLFDFTIVPIDGRPDCKTHYNLWYLIDMPEKVEFKYDTREFYQAGWHTYAQAIEKLHNHAEFYLPVMRRLNSL